jgi:hypothetical protein
VVLKPISQFRGTSGPTGIHEKREKLGMVAHAYNPSIWEVKAGYEFQASMGYIRR